MVQQRSNFNKKFHNLITAIIITASLFLPGGAMDTAMYNRLAQEQSPYLLEHARQPVHWFPWGEEAFRAATQKERPIMLSIGYSTCHWCHVMAQESFSDPQVARLLNDHFVAIKVDREERPDIDQIYIEACRAMQGRCGWPLTVFMTPTGKPFFIATYIPKEDHQGRPGLISLLQRIHNLWQNERQNLQQHADKVVQGLQQGFETPDANQQSTYKPKLWQATWTQLSQYFDEQNGGFGEAPKFPQLSTLSFLYDYAYYKDNQQARAMSHKTLQAMALGGIYDHVGFGFHRYSTDPAWLLPHFEKMLYDQAWALALYSRAYRQSDKESPQAQFYARIAQEISQFVQRELQSDHGGFYSALDADSEGQEGQYYLWDYKQLAQSLSPQDFNWLKEHFPIQKEGNFRFETGERNDKENILYLNTKLTDKQQKTWDSIRRKLLDSRQQRPRPGLDDKILTDWNGMMIAALAQAGRTLGNEQMIQTAINGENFLRHNMLERQSELSLWHRFRQGEKGIVGQLGDYAFYIYALIELYESTGEVAYLELSQKLMESSIKKFWNSKGFFYLTQKDNKPDSLFKRPVEITDGALPSANSIQAHNLSRLAGLLFHRGYRNKLEQMLAYVSPSVKRAPLGFPMISSTADSLFYPQYELVIALPSQNFSDGKPQALQKELKPLWQNDYPNLVSHIVTEKNRSELSRLLPTAQAQEAVEGKTTYYLCQQEQCQAPTHDLNQVLELILPES